MNAREIVEAIRRDRDDWLRAVSEVPPDTGLALEEALPELGTRALMLLQWFLAQREIDGAEAILLALTANGDPQVAVPAAAALARICDPRGVSQILAVAPLRGDPMVRENLYLAAGRGAREELPRLREVLRRETNPRALEAGRAAAARLGGEDERAALFCAVFEARPSAAVRLHEDLIYAGDPDSARALAPWFDVTTIVRDVGSHMQSIPVRVCDLAARAAAKLLSLREAEAMAAIGRYDDGRVAAARRAVHQAIEAREPG